MKEEYMSVQEVAWDLDVSLSTVYSYIQRGLIPSQPVASGLLGRRQHRIPRQEYLEAKARLLEGLAGGDILGRNQRETTMEAVTA
jgi:excisionase family DNA binding protein